MLATYLPRSKRDSHHRVPARPDIAGKLVADPVTGEERPIALGEDYKGRPVDRDRDVWVLQVTVCLVFFPLLPTRFLHPHLHLASGPLKSLDLCMAQMSGRTAGDGRLWHGAERFLRSRGPAAPPQTAPAGPPQEQGRHRLGDSGVVTVLGKIWYVTS